MHDAERYATIQRAVNQADLEISQVIGDGGVGKASFIGAYHDLESYFSKFSYDLPLVLIFPP
jgi:hypothetical protein